MVTYVCKRCKFPFDHKGTYDKHIKRKTKCRINNSGSKTVAKKVHYCDICRINYERGDILTRHLRTKLSTSMRPACPRRSP